VSPMRTALSRLERNAVFQEDRARTYGAPSSANVLIHAENLEAMRRLASAGYEGRFRCIYFDPPFNSGRRFTHYDDALAPDAWLEMMRERLAAARPLLSDDGAVFVEIDDTELGPLQVAMDETYGREQRVSTITIVRSAATGHKTINRGPVNVTDFLLAYAKDRSRWRCNPLVRERRGYDEAYSTWLENPRAPFRDWRFEPLVTHARRVLGADASRATIQRYAVEHAECVVGFV
jgi:adenine-specific DNA-methyltransferase